MKTVDLPIRAELSGISKEQAGKPAGLAGWGSCPSENNPALCPDWHIRVVGKVNPGRTLKKRPITSGTKDWPGTCPNVNPNCTVLAAFTRMKTVALPIRVEFSGIPKEQAGKPAELTGRGSRLSENNPALCPDWHIRVVGMGNPGRPTKT